MMFTAIMPALQNSMQLSNQEIGLLVGALSLGYAALSYPASFASGRVDERWVISAGITLSSVSALVFSMSRSFAAMFVLSFLMGAGFSTYVPQAYSLLSREYSTHRLGFVLGVHETGAPVGQTVGPLFVWFTVGVLGWSGCLQAWVIFSLVVCILILFLVPKGKGVTQSPPKGAARKHLSPLLLLAMVATQTAVWSCNLGLLSMVPVYLAKTFLLDVSYVAFILGLSRVTGAVGQLAGGHLSDKLGRTLVLLSSTVMVFVATLWITLVPFSDFYVAGLFFQGIVSATFFPVFFATMSDITDYSNRARMVGLTNSVAGFVGGTVTPAVIGYLSDRFTFQTAFLFPIATGIVACATAFYVWNATSSVRKR